MFLKNLSSIQKSTLLILFVTGLIKIPLILRDIVMAGYFGVAKNMDIYLYALVVPTFVATIASASFSYFVIPSYLKIKSQQGRMQGREYMGQFLFLTIIFTTFLVMLIGLIIPHFLIYLNPKFFVSPAMTKYFFMLSFLITIFIGLQLISILLTFFLQAEHRYLSSLIPQTFAPFMSIYLLVLYGKTLGVITVVYGGLIGIVLNLFFLLFLIKRLDLISWPKPTTLFNKTAISYNQFWILNIAFIMPAFIAVIDQQLAVGLGEGKLTTLTYGIRVPDGISEILCAGLGMAVFSHFSEWATKNDHQKLCEAIQKVIVFSTLTIIPLSIFIFLYASPIITLLFERGVFTKVAADNVSQALKFYCFAIYFTVLATIGAKAISAIGKNTFFVRYAINICIVKILLNFILINFIGLNGIILATVLTLVVNCCLVFHFLMKNNIWVFDHLFLIRLSKCLLLTLVFLIILTSLRIISMSFLPGLQISLAAICSAILLFIFLKTNPKLIYN